MRKNPNIIKIAKFYVKEIKYLQVLIFAKSDFFSRPQNSQRYFSSSVSSVSSVVSSLKEAMRPISLRYAPRSSCAAANENAEKPS